MITLPMRADQEQIARAIEDVQRRCRSRLCKDPGRLAERVVRQRDRLMKLHADSGVEDLRELMPKMSMWEPGHPLSSGDITHVDLDPWGINVARGKPTRPDGILYIELAERTSSPRRSS